MAARELSLGEGAAMSEDEAKGGVEERAAVCRGLEARLLVSPF